LAPAEARRLAPRTAVASQADRAQDFDPAATTARVPHDVFTVVRDALALGPVLVHVPHAGFRRHLTCARCRTPLRCPCGGPLEDSSSGLACAWDGRAFREWTCPVCRSRQHRAATVGHRRQALELERAFPGVEVLKADGEHPVAAAPDRPCLVVATPGAEPTAPGGYAAAVILDAAATLGRASLRAAEEALRRWLQVTALVRPGSQSGSVILVGPAEDRTVQAWLRLDPAGHATRELADRRATELPPACRMAELKGDPEAVAELRRSLADGAPGPSPLRRSLADGAPGPSSDTSGGQGDLSWLVPLGPVPDPLDPERHRLFLRAPAAHGRDLARVVHDLAAARSAAKAKGVVSFHVDPQDLA
jgi:primosomal protein N' (replication factor Y)